MKLDKLPGPIPESQMARIILEAHPYGLVKVLVHGRERIGKSLWTIKVMWEIYEALGYSEDEAYEKAFENMFFRPERFLEKIDRIEKEIEEKGFKAQLPAIAIDDAGIGLGGGLYDLDRSTYWELRETWPTLGAYVTGVFLTTPDPDDIAGQFRGWNYRVKIVENLEGGAEWGRRALAYAEGYDVLGLRSRATREGGFKENFSCFLPNKWFEPYYKRRLEFRREIKERREKTKQRREEEGEKVGKKPWSVKGKPTDMLMPDEV